MPNWLSAWPVSAALPLPGATSVATTRSRARTEEAGSVSSGSPGPGSVARRTA
jgi:hypothetical protein